MAPPRKLSITHYVDSSVDCTGALKLTHVNPSVYGLSFSLFCFRCSRCYVRRTDACTLAAVAALRDVRLPQLSSVDADADELPSVLAASAVPLVLSDVMVAVSFARCCGQVSSFAEWLRALPLYASIYVHVTWNMSVAWRHHIMRHTRAHAHACIYASTTTRVEYDTLCLT